MKKNKIVIILFLLLGASAYIEASEGMPFSEEELTETEKNTALKKFYFAVRKPIFGEVINKEAKASLSEHDKHFCLRLNYKPEDFLSVNFFVHFFKKTEEIQYSSLIMTDITKLDNRQQVNGEPKTIPSVIEMPEYVKYALGKKTIENLINDKKLTKEKFDFKLPYDSPAPFFLFAQETKKLKLMWSKSITK